MYQASEKYNTVILGDDRTFRAKIKCGDTEITSGIISINQYAQSASDTITVGGAMSSYVEIQMWKPDIQLEGSEIEVSIGLMVDGALEYVPLGLYTVQKPEDDDGVILFTGYDRIQSKMGGAYFSELPYPADGKAVLSEISSKTGVPIDTGILPDGIMISQRAVVSEVGVDDDGNEITSTTYANPFDGYTYREALGYIAMLYCKFATVDRSGTIVFRWYTDTGYTVEPNRYYDDLVTSETVFTIGAISCTAGDTVLTAGSGTETIQLENPVMTQERLDAIYESIKFLRFLPAGLSFYGDMRPDIGDIVTVNDKYGNIVRIPVMSVTQEFDGGLLTKIQSFGGAEQESADTKGPTAKKMDRVYTDLFLVKELIGNKADFDYVHGKVGEFEQLKVDVGNFETAMVDELIVAKGWMLEGSIGSAQIQSLDVNKLNSGTIDTAVVNLASSDSALQITGAQVLVNDAADPLNPHNRVVLGKYIDASGNTEYGLLVRSADGQTIMMDGEGVHNAGITDGAISNNKVADDANISSYKLDLRTINEAMTEQGVRIDETIVRVGNKSLEVVLKEQEQAVKDIDISGRNLLRNSKALIYEKYGFVKRENGYTDEFGNTLTDESGNVFVVEA